MDQITLPSGITLPTRIELEQFDAGMPLRPLAPFSGSGWALSASPVTDISIYLGPDLLCHAVIGLARPDVGKRHWFYPGSEASGFRFSVQLPARLEPEHATLRVVVGSASGTDERSYALTLGAVPPPIAVAPPVFQPRQTSTPEAMLVRIEEARVTAEGVLRVRGWAVSFSPLEEISISLGGRLLGLAEAGIARADVADALADYPDAKTSGFLFQQMLDESTPAGDLLVHVAAQGGIFREVALAITRPAGTRRRSDEVSAAAIKYHCDVVHLTENGNLAVLGWAACPSGVRQIEVELDGEPVGSVELGGARPDVGNNYPEIPGARNAGFRFRAALGRDCAGERLLRLTIRGAEGEERVVLHSVRAQPAPAVGALAKEVPAIRSHLETPSVTDKHAAGTVRGFMSVNGWAFAPDGISEIEVFVDGISQGNAHYGIRREDLQAAFPTENALMAGFAMLVPPQVMKPGRHEVRIVIRAKKGESEETTFSVDAEAPAEGPGPWQIRHKLRAVETDLQLRIVDAVGPRPDFTIAMMASAASPTLLAAAADTIASLCDQVYPNWTMRVIVHHPGHVVLLRETCDLRAGEFSTRITVSADDPFAAIEPTGLICQLRPGDLLGEDALLEMAVERAIRPGADFLYSDERRIDPSDGVVKAFFKPDWSPDLLLSTNYIGRLWAVSPALLKRAGISFGEVTELGEYDLVLRLTEQARDIVHVAKVLCTRGTRQIDTRAQERAALAAAMKRRGVRAEILSGCVAGSYRVRRRTAGRGLVSIIIPSVATRGLIKTTIESIRAKTAYRNFEIICIDNIVANGDEEKLRWKRWIADNSDVVVQIRERFNWSRFNNKAAKRARGEFLLFLNDDVEVLAPDWLDAMLEHARRPEIGVVGPQLLYPDGRVQHAGMFLGGNVGRHAFRFYPSAAPGPFGLARTQRNVIAVTGACMLMRRNTFETLDGFDEAHAVVNNDLDFCLRLNKAGMRVVYTPHATLIHHEMVSRSKLRDVYNSSVFDAAWKDLFLKGDPYFNPNLTTEFDDYLPEAEPVQQLHVGHPLIHRNRVRRILAVKVDHIGDFIAVFPALRRIKARFPNAELCVLAARASLSIAALEPTIDRVIEFNFYHAKSSRGARHNAAKELRELEKKLASEKFDLAIDLRRQPDTRHLLQHTGARWLAGFDQNYRNKWLDIAIEWEGDLARNHKRTHVIDSLVQLVDAVAEACDSDRDVVHHPISPAKARADVALLAPVEELGPAMFSRRLVCVHTGAGAENKQWPPRSFAGLIDLLIGEEGVNVVLVGGPDDLPITIETLRHVRRTEAVFSLVGKTSLHDLMKVLRASDLYIGNDSGPKHMAASVGVPTIGIHAGSVDTVEWGPMGPSAFAIRRDVTCSPCYLARASDCHRGLACLNGIKVSDVYRGCQRMLALTRAVDIVAEIIPQAIPRSSCSRRSASAKGQPRRTS